MFLSDETTTLSSLLQMIHFNYISLRALSNHIPKEIRMIKNEFFVTDYLISKESGILEWVWDTGL